MKVAITGHTRGIGLGIKNYFENKGYEVLGFSKSNGFDISNTIVREKIVKLAIDCDIFVNNAYTPDGSQFSVLKKIHSAWQGQDKKIINISTRYTNKDELYCIRKRQMDDFCQEHTFHLPYILNLKPGAVDTDRMQSHTGPKMSVEEVVKMMDWALEQNPRIYSITFGK